MTRVGRSFHGDSTAGASFVDLTDLFRLQDFGGVGSSGLEISIEFCTGGMYFVPIFITRLVNMNSRSLEPRNHIGIVLKYMKLEI